MVIVDVFMVAFESKLKPVRYRDNLWPKMLLWSVLLGLLVLTVVTFFLALNSKFLVKMGNFSGVRKQETGVGIPGPFSILTTEYWVPEFRQEFRSQESKLRRLVCENSLAVI